MSVHILEMYTHIILLHEFSLRVWQFFFFKANHESYTIISISVAREFPPYSSILHGCEAYKCSTKTCV